MSGPLSVSMTIKLIDEASSGARSIASAMRDLKSAGEEVSAMGGTGDNGHWMAERDAVRGVIAEVKTLGDTSQSTGAIDAVTARYEAEASAVRGVAAEIGALNVAAAQASAPIEGAVAKWDEEKQAVAGVTAEVKTLGDLPKATGAIDTATARYEAEASAVRGVAAEIGALNAAAAKASAPIEGAVAALGEEAKAVEGVIAKMEALKSVAAEAATVVGGTTSGGGEAPAGWVPTVNPNGGKWVNGQWVTGGPEAWEKAEAEPRTIFPEPPAPRPGVRASDVYGREPPEPPPVLPPPEPPPQPPRGTSGGFLDTMVGFAEMATGLKLLHGSYEQASEAQGHDVGMRAAGIPEGEASAIRAGAERMSRDSIFTRNEVIDLARDARTVLGTTHHALEAMPDILSLATIAEAQKHGEGQQGVLSLLKGMETSGATTSVEKFHALADSIAKVTNVFGKTIDFGARGQFYKYAGPSAQRMSPEFTEQKLPHLIQELGGASTGTMFQAMNRAIIGQHMDLAAMHELQRLGLLDPTKVHDDGKGKMKLDAGAVRGGGEFMRDPSDWVQTYLKPALASMPEEERAHALGTIFSNHVSERGMSILENQDASIQKDAAQIRAAPGLDAAPVLTRDDPHLANKAAGARIKDLEEKAGEPVIGPMVSAENAFTAALGRATGALGQIPGAATAFEGALIAGAGYMGWKTWETGLANVAKAMIKAPEELVRGVIDGIRQAKEEAAERPPAATKAGAPEPAPEPRASAGGEAKPGTADPTDAGATRTPGTTGTSSETPATKAGAAEPAASGLSKVGAAAEAASTEFGAASTSLGSLALLFQWASQSDIVPATRLAKSIGKDELRHAGSSGFHLPGDTDGPHGGASASWGDDPQPAPPASRQSGSPTTSHGAFPVTMTSAVNAAFAAHDAVQPKPVETAATPPQVITNNQQRYITAPITVTVPVSISATLTNTTPGAIANVVTGAVHQAVRASTAALHDGTESR